MCRSLICPACVCLSASHFPAQIPLSGVWFNYPRATLLSFRGSVRLSVRGPCECDRVYTIAYFFVKLGRYVNHDERMHPIDFGGQRSKVKVTMDIYGNKLVNTIVCPASVCVCVCLSDSHTSPHIGITDLSGVCVWITDLSGVCLSVR